MIKRNVTVRITDGLQGSGATQFVRRANAYDCTIQIIFGSNRLNAKSLLGIMSLDISQGSTAELIADGPDETAALDDLQNFLQAGKPV